GDIASRLFEVGTQAWPLQHLGHDVRRPLARDVGAAELCDGVVAVGDQHPLVELGRAPAFLPVDYRPAIAEPVGELIEEKTTERARVARVAGKQRSLDGLGEIQQREDRAIEAREVRRETLTPRFGESLDRISHGSPMLTTRAAPAAFAGAAVFVSRTVTR